VKIQKLFLVLVGLVCPMYLYAEADGGADGDTQAANYFVSRSEDDAEEGTNGQVDLANEDLDLGQLSGFESAATIGIRFDGIRIPKGRKIKRAFVQFTMEGNRAKAKPTELTLRAELAPDADAFKKEQKNISSRRLTKASVNWSPEPWNPKRARDKRPQTPDMSALIQEVVDQIDWMEGNALVLIISGKGERDAVSFDGGGKQEGPMLRLETD
jgi:hypothetical protein